MIEKEVTTKYGLVNREGRLIRIAEFFNGDAEYCNEYSYRLSECLEDPEFLVDSLDKAIYVFLHNTNWDSSTTERPSHGLISMKEVSPCQVRVIRAINRIDVTGNRCPVGLLSIEMDK